MSTNYDRASARRPRFLRRADALPYRGAVCARLSTVALRAIIVLAALALVASGRAELSDVVWLLARIYGIGDMRSDEMAVHG